MTLKFFAALFSKKERRVIRGGAPDWGFGRGKAPCTIYSFCIKGNALDASFYLALKGFAL